MAKVWCGSPRTRHHRCRVHRLVLGTLTTLLIGCGEAAPTTEAVSLLGTDLVRPSLPEELAERQKMLLAEAEAGMAARPEDPEPVIWSGRRLGYLGRYGEAVERFSEGHRRFPDDPRFLRHRGHRQITLRRFAEAAEDLERGLQLAGDRPDEVEPDGLPNERNQPTSTLFTNLWYHHGLARYLQGDFSAALVSYRRCLERSSNPDMQVATRYWLYWTLRQLGRGDLADEALRPVGEDLDIIENHDYHRLLLAYRDGNPEGLLEGLEPGSVAFATLGYGVARWHASAGRDDAAVALLRKVVEAGNWAAFGAIAAEAELARREP